MKLQTILISVSLLMVSCENKNQLPLVEVVEEFDDGSPRKVLKYIIKDNNMMDVENYKRIVSEEVLYVRKGNYNDFYQKWFYDNNQIKTSGKYIDRKEDSTFTWYYENGNIQDIVNYKDGNKDGVVKKFHQNGQLKNFGKYKNNKLVGEWIYYFEDGEIQIKCNFKNDTLDGDFYRYDKIENIKSQGMMKNSVYDGEWILYKDDSIYSKQYWKDGELVENKQYSKDGGIIKTTKPTGVRHYFIDEKYIEYYY